MKSGWEIFIAQELFWLTFGNLIFAECLAWAYGMNGNQFMKDVMEITTKKPCLILTFRSNNNV